MIKDYFTLIYLTFVSCLHILLINFESIIHFVIKKETIIKKFSIVTNEMYKGNKESHRISMKSRIQLSYSLITNDN